MKLERRVGLASAGQESLNHARLGGSGNRRLSSSACGIKNLLSRRKIQAALFIFEKGLELAKGMNLAFPIADTVLKSPNGLVRSIELLHERLVTLVGGLESTFERVLDLSISFDLVSTAVGGGNRRTMVSASPPPLNRFLHNRGHQVGGHGSNCYSILSCHAMIAPNRNLVNL